MDLYLQYGHSMRPTCVELLRSWKRGTVLLSPRDIPPVKLPKIAAELATHGAQVLLDPQFYLPYADHSTLCEHSYWPQEYQTDGFWNGPGLKQLLDEIVRLNVELGTAELILPGLFAEEIDDIWLECQANIIEDARGRKIEKPLIATVALGADAMEDDEQIQDLADAIEGWDVDGVYLVCEHPDQYFVTDTNWLTNLLELLATIRLSDRRVILGYANQQMLIAGCAGVNAIASGTWMNVRSFTPQKFNKPDPDEVKTKAIWYYAPDALSEYKITFLDVAFRQGLIEKIQASVIYGSRFADSMFQNGVRPSTLGLKEPDSFKHFLQCLHAQAKGVQLQSYQTTVDAYENLLNSAERLIAELHQKGVRGQTRDFADALDVNRAALAVLKSTHGPMLKRRWSELV